MAACLKNFALIVSAFFSFTAAIVPYKTAYFEQNLDHFNFVQDKTFKQRYLYTGSGKTFTMMGSLNQTGLIPRLCDELFDRISKNEDENITYKVEVSYIEIYNEKVRDLLCPRGCMRGICVRMRGICWRMRGVCGAYAGICGAYADVCGAYADVCGAYAGVCGAYAGVCGAYAGVCGHMLAYAGHMLAYAGHMLAYAGHMLTYAGHMLAYAGHMLAYAGHMLAYAGHMLAYAGHMLAEGPITRFWDNSGFVFEAAEKFNALVIFGEHKHEEKKRPRILTVLLLMFDNELND
ncbi:Kinesin-like protein kif13b [Desmophyllum pertusum]|uniref:Kinesin-like protein kif13b n=1 Tax=Desmophyllum pertusum TaxID=174260 RepID=A0A9W9YU76_9CNID|nr:Kinesin-like protein kif13b [Desmophyllum pertusum]